MTSCSGGQAKCDYNGEGSRIDIDPDGDLYLKVGVTECIFSDSDEEEEEEEELEDDLLMGEMEEPADEVQVDEGEQKAEAAAEAEVVHDDEKHDHSLPTTFRVCSRTLARSSPVWKKMLYGGFAESKPKDGDWIVELPDDDVPAMEFFLSAIHARFDKVPPFDLKPDFLWLYEVSVIADKYDIVHLLRPWAKAWIKYLNSRVSDASADLSLEHCLWISWILGAETKFRRIIKHKAMKGFDRTKRENTLTPEILELPETRSKKLYPPPSQIR